MENVSHWFGLKLTYSFHIDNEQIRINYNNELSHARRLLPSFSFVLILYDRIGDYLTDHSFLLFSNIVLLNIIETLL